MSGPPESTVPDGRREWPVVILVSILVAIAASIPVFCFRWWATHDSISYPLRLAEFSQHVFEGEWYPRWASNFYWGYGYPLFNFYPPLGNYIGTAIHAVGAPVLTATKCLELITWLVAFAGLYRLCRLLVTADAALLAAATGTLAPYRFVDIYVRGDLAESLASALVPLIFAEALLLARQSCRSAGLRLAVLLALVFYSHTLTAFMTSIALALFGLWHLARKNPGGFTRTALWSGLGLLYSAAYWLPAFAEKKWVNVSVMTQRRDSYTFFWGDHFLEWWQRLDLTFGFGPSLPGPEDRMNFAASYLILASVLYALCRLREAGGRRRYGPPLLALAAVQLMMLPVSSPLWANLPLIGFFQFPWRFLILDTVIGTAIFALAAGELWNERQPWLVRGTAAAASIAFVTGIIQNSLTTVPAPSVVPSLWLLAAIAGTALLCWKAVPGPAGRLLPLPLLAAVPGLLATIVHAQATEYPRSVTADNPALSSAVVRRDASVRFWQGAPRPIETTAPDEFLPITVQEIPAYRERGQVRFESETGSYELLETRASLRRWRLESPGPQPVRLPAFWFPGWETILNGTPVPTAPGRDGLIRLEIPAGENLISIRYAGSRISLLAELVTALSLAGTGLFWLWMRRRSAAS